VADHDQKNANTWLTVTLKEGKNREIRRVMQALELHVGRLIRTAYGPFNLDLLERGSVKEIKEHVLKDQVAGYFKGKS
jgi:23S rRNA pseudouridine2605 synthase